MKENIIKVTIILFIIAIIIYNFFIKDKLNSKNEILQNHMYENQVFFNTSHSSNSNDESKEQNKIKVYITGEVLLPGVYELEEGSRIEDAITVAGGISQNASLKDVNLAYVLEDAMKIYIPNKSEETEQKQIVTTDDASIQSYASITSSTSTISSPSSSSKVNINKASITDLETINGIGPGLAQKIITYREEHGKFSSIDDIKNVSGIGDKKFEKIKDSISV